MLRTEVDWDAKRWTIPATKMKNGWDHVVPLSRQALAILKRVQHITGNRRYVFACAKDAPLSSRTLCHRLRSLGIDTKTEHCAHGFRATFSTLCRHEEINEAKVWDGDIVERQLAHLDSDSVRSIYKLARTISVDRVAHQVDATLGRSHRWLCRFEKGCADYPRTTNKILEAYLKSKGLSQGDIMINYTPFGYSDWQAIVSDIQFGRQEDGRGHHQRRRQHSILQ
ncbi:Prophage integrase IntA [Bradyrhizobium ivorense]|nr:Prophage integrase IntA [Bradyrhizobium ivorense]